MFRSEWWRGLPFWLKLAYLFLAIPAWLFIGYCVVTGEDKIAAALAAFGVFAFAAILMLVFDRRKGLVGREGGGIDFGGGDG